MNARNYLSKKKKNLDVLRKKIVEVYLEDRQRLKSPRQRFEG